MEALSSRKHVLAIGCIFGLTLTRNTISSMVAPFLPARATQLGGGLSEINLLFAINPATIFLTSTPLALLCEKVGFSVVLQAGVLLLGVSTVLFGTLDSSLALLCIFRALQGVGSAAVSTTTMALVSTWYPLQRTFVLGLAETATGIAVMVGPPFGGGLFQLGGFALPFIVTGGFVLLQLLVLPCLLVSLSSPIAPSQESLVSPTLLSDDIHPSGAAPKSKIRAVFACDFILPVLVLLVAESCFALVMPVFAAFVEETFETTAFQTGLFFSAPAIAYTLFAPVAGLLVPRCGFKWVVMTGLACNVLGYFFLCPMPWVALEKGSISHGVLVAVSFGAVGCGFAFAYLPTMPMMIGSLERSEVDSPAGFAAGVWAAVFALAQVLGYFMGSVLVSAYGLQWTTVQLSCATCAVLLVVWICGKDRPPKTTP